MYMITAVIETPRGQGQKFDFDPESGCFKLKKMMPSGMVFPFDFGFVPGTIGDDGDPIDVMVISEAETFTGCAIDCRLIGAITAKQTERDGTEVRNDRLVAVPEVSMQYKAVHSLNDLPKDILSQIENFFYSYNTQAGKEFKVLARVTPERAWRLVKKGKVEESQKVMIRLFLPIYDKDGMKFPDHYYTTLHKKLSKKFGGLTVYTRSIAKGFWKAKAKVTIKENVLIHEVMAANVDKLFWQKIKSSMMKKFAQRDLLITSSKISRI